MDYNERELAVSVLIEVGEGSYNNIALRKALGGADMSREGRAFVTECVNGVLRNRIYIDYVLNTFSKTPTTGMKPFILNNLRAGAYQILFMDRVPVSAACNEAVKLAKKRGFAGLSGFVNAVLRRVAREGAEVVLPDANASPEEYLSIKYSLPEWLAKRLIGELGYGSAKEMATACNVPPDICVCVNTLKTTVEVLKGELLSLGIDVSNGWLAKNALHIRKTSDIRSLESFRRGLFHVMDESAMLAVEAAAPKPGQSVLDICAAPGGKSFLAAYMAEDGADILARDIFSHKLRLIEDGAERLGLGSVRAQLFDATETDISLQGRFDLVIADLPCSGLGLLRKKPDIKYTKSEFGITELAGLQRRILAAAQGYVKPGGSLLYSTCTLTKEENLDNFNWLLERFPFEAADISLIGERTMPYGTAARGYFQILPQDYQTDGFFISKAVRKA